MARAKHEHPHHHSHEHPDDHAHEHGHAHGHRHGPWWWPFHAHEHEHHMTVNPQLLATEKGIWATKWSLVGLLATAVIQVFIVLITNSTALLADTIHNFADGLTAIPLWVAYSLSRRRATRRFTYGYGRAEDFAGLFIVTVIFASAVVAAWTAINRMLHPVPISNLGALAAAGIVGFLGNEVVAQFRIRVGRQIHSAALVADGYHSRTDGFTSLMVVGSAAAVYLGVPVLDPILGLGISAVIVWIVLQAAREVLTRAMGGVDPHLVDQVEATASGTEGVVAVHDVRMQWLGHALHGELSASVAPHLTVAEAHALAAELEHRLLHAVPSLYRVAVHIDPADSPGEQHHAHPERHS